MSLPELLAALGIPPVADPVANPFRPTDPLVFAPADQYPDCRHADPLHQAGDVRGPVTVVAPCLNEAASIEAWVAAIKAQTRQPAEVIVTDAGSTDGSPERLWELLGNAPFPFKLLSVPGATPAAGRNAAIRKASHPVIACVDFGCLPAADWLEHLIRPFERYSATEICGGVVLTNPQTPVARAWAKFCVTNPAAIDPRIFIPGGANIAFTKALWARVGGYSERLTLAGEDNVFGRAAREATDNWAFAPLSGVTWDVPDTLRDVFRKAHGYGRGGGEAQVDMWAYLDDLARLGEPLDGDAAFEHYGWVPGAPEAAVERLVLGAVLWGRLWGYLEGAKRDGS